MPHRSPVIFWLLLAATICIDAVAMSWSYIAGLQRTEQLYLALFCGQLSAICIWSVFSLRSGYWRFLVPFAMAFAGALWAGWVSYDRVGLTAEAYAVAHAGLWATHAALLMGLLWVLRQLSITSGLSFKNSASRWQFSIGQLLVLMTTVAILIVILRKAELIHEVWVWIAVLLANNVGIAIAVALIHTTDWHWLVRATVAAGVAIALGVVVLMINRSYSEILVINLIQTFVLFLWLEYGGLMHERSSVISGDLGRPKHLRPE
jgi:hypothetical protein